MDNRTEQRIRRAEAIFKYGGINKAIEVGALPAKADITLSEAVVLGLLLQDVRIYIGIFGHGSTEIGEVLRIYENTGLVRTFGVRHETEAVHAASALRWVTGEKAAVFTSIGPGALQALAGSLVPQSDGLGVWFLLGDETSEDEGPNMQQIARPGQHGFLRLFSAMGETYVLHTPGAVATALRRGYNTVDHPFRPGPFFLLMPMNTQASVMNDFNLESLPIEPPPQIGPAADNGSYRRAAKAILEAERVVVKVGGGACKARRQIMDFLDLSGAAAVTSPLVPGLVPFSHPQNMTVGGSKGSISGNHAMENADLLVALGTRFVCQSDCSRTGYPNVRQVVNINADVEAAMHYAGTIPLVGDIGGSLELLNETIREISKTGGVDKSAWLNECAEKRKEWDAFRQERYKNPILFDEAWKALVLTQPAVIKTASDWARKNGVITFFDAGDVQANGFQIVEDDIPGRTFTETGASYMGFAVSALLAASLASKRFYALALTGDGSFTMNPQILIDGAAHGATGCIVILDNRSMAAIAGLQNAQYGKAFATGDGVVVDYAAWARSVSGVVAFDNISSTEELVRALDGAFEHDGLSVIHVPVYSGDDPLGGMGVFGRWNVGGWCEATQKMRHDIGL